jgi:hypothetical protein
MPTYSVTFTFGIPERNQSATAAFPDLKTALEDIRTSMESKDWHSTILSVTIREGDFGKRLVNGEWLPAPEKGWGPRGWELMDTSS